MKKDLKLFIFQVKILKKRRDQKQFKKLESINPEEKIDYIFTVDIFNEGIDIPKNKSNSNASTYAICNYLCSTTWKRT